MAVLMTLALFDDEHDADEADDVVDDFDWLETLPSG